MPRPSLRASPHPTRSQFLIPVDPVFNRGPGPAPVFQGGLLWTAEPFAPGPGPGPAALSPLNYYLAGAAGVPV